VQLYGQSPDELRFGRIVLEAMRLLLVILLTLGLGSLPAASRDVSHGERVEVERTQPWRVTSFLEDANLQGRGVFFVDFEADGTAWIAASDGLYRYDGYRWDRFTSAHGLPSDFVRSVRVTRDGTLWVGTDRGAGTFDGSTFDSRGSEAHLAGPSVRRIVEDPDGTLWFCCDQWPPSDVQAGLTRYRDGTWNSWRSADGLPSDYVSDVFRDEQGRHFVLTRRGLARFDGERLIRPIEEAGIEECRDYIWSMAESSEGQAIVTTNDWLCIRQGRRWHRVPNRSPRIALGQIAATRDGAILGCTSESAAKFVEWKNGRFVPLWTTELDTSGSVQYIGEAPDGAIWVAGTNLLARWERLGGEWRSFDDLPAPRLRDVEGGIWFAEDNRVIRLHEGRWESLADASAPLVEDSSGGVWMRDANGLVRWSDDGLTRFTEEAIGVRDPRDGEVDGAGNLWFTGTSPRGPDRLTRFDGKDWTPYDLIDIKPTERIVFGAPDNDWGMWSVLHDLEADRYRLLRVDRAKAVDVPLPVEAGRFWMPLVQVDTAGRLWLYGQMGLYERDPDADPGGWQQVTALRGEQVRNVAVRGEEVWFSYQGSTGGSGGITRLVGDTWHHFSSAARNLTSIDDGVLFFTHPKGVYFVVRGSPRAPRLLVLPEAARVNSLVPTSQGDVWVGAGTRVFHYRPDGITPETVIAHGKKDISYGEDLILDVRGVERFKSLARPGNMNVAVQLDDQPWGEFEPLSNGRVTIDNLAIGDHVVHVRVQDQGLDIDQAPASWRFRLNPVPLQARSWFQPLVIGVTLTVLLLAGLIVVTRRREVRQRLRKQELEHEILGISEREQRRIGRDLHDGLGQRLTSISFQCEALRGMVKRGDIPSSQRVTEIGAEVRRAISETRVLAHALYPAEIDRDDLKVALSHLVASIDRGFGGTCTHRHHWSPGDLNRQDSLNVYRLVQEALSNAIRHSGAATLYVESRRDNGEWIIEVRDDGCGFDTGNSAGAGLGLQIMRYRADRIGGRLTVESSPGGGTTVRCALQLDGQKTDRPV